MNLPPVTPTSYRDLVKADFGVSGGVVLAVTLAFVLLLAFPPRRVRKVLSALRVRHA